MKSRAVLELLRKYESRNVTFIENDGSWPIVWARSRGTHVWDAEGRKYLDLTAAFGVAAAGHGNPRVVRVGQKQMGVLLHAMGDVHPHLPKAKLIRELSRLTFERWTRGQLVAKTILGSSGFEAVEAALKTVRLATGRRGVIAFEGGYHGLGYGALNATHRRHFREHFQNQLGQFAEFLPFPKATCTRNEWTDFDKKLRELLRRKDIGGILVEPIQVRGGINVPPAKFLPALRRACDESGALLVLDEIYTGFGRTGAWFACEHSGVVPDLICLGKALTGGFPLSACVGKAELMDKAWPSSAGEAIHTSTFLGHPVGCAMALAQIDEIRRQRLVERSRRMGLLLLKEIQTVRSPKFVLQARGMGLLAGLELLERNGAPATGTVNGVLKEMLRRGFILLPEGEAANVISFSPSLTISERELKRTVDELGRLLQS